MKPRQQILNEHCANSCNTSCKDETRLYSDLSCGLVLVHGIFLFELKN